MSVIPDQGEKKVRLLRRLDGAPVVFNGEKPANNLVQNLQPLSYNKKLVAQKLYYEQNPEHISPLLKREKGPVKERLGVKQMRLRRNNMPLGTNTSSILPRKRLFRPNNMRQNNPGLFRRNKLNWIYSAQDRIERIRRQQQNNKSPIKLRRGKSLTIQVDNTNFTPSANRTTGFTYEGYQKFKMVLNAEIQDEIQEIQRENMDKSMGPLSPLTKITPVTTEIPLTTRFALL